jgi:hypothetical protein
MRIDMAMAIILVLLVLGLMIFHDWKLESLLWRPTTTWCQVCKIGSSPSFPAGRWEFTYFDYEALLDEAHACNERRVEMLADRQGQFKLYDSLSKSYSAHTARTPLHFNRYLNQP